MNDHRKTTDVINDIVLDTDVLNSFFVETSSATHNMKNEQQASNLFENYEIQLNNHFNLQEITVEEFLKLGKQMKNITANDYYDLNMKLV